MKVADRMRDIMRSVGYPCVPRRLQLPEHRDHGKSGEDLP